MLTTLDDLAQILFVLLVFPFPIGSDRPFKRFPWCTAVIVFVNSVVFFLSRSQTASSLSMLESFYSSWGLIPHSLHLYAFITSLFIHSSVSHLLWNMGFLVLIGPALEDALGRYRFLALYLGGGIAAELLHVLIALYAAGAKDVAFQPLVGASGAIAASAGLYAFRCYASRIRVFWLPASVFSREGGVWEIPALLAILLWMGLNVAGAVACLFDASRSEVAYWAHIGGFLFGVSIAVCGNLLGEGKKERLLEEVRADLAMGGEARIYGTLEKLRNALIQSPGDAETKRMLVGIASRYGARSKGRAMVAKEYGLLIDSYFEKGMPDLAMRWIEEAHVIDLSPALSATSLFALARFLTRRGSFDSAAQVYARLLAEQPLSANAPIAYLELADLQLNRLNRPADASATLHEYCSKQVRVSAAS